MHLETPKPKTGSVYGRNAPTNLASGYSATHCYWLFCLCIDFSLSWTFSKIWVNSKSEPLFSIFIPVNFSQLAVSSLSTTQVDGRYDVRVLFNGAYRRVGAFFFYRKSRWHRNLSRLVKNFCFLSTVFHWSVPFQVIDDKLPLNPTDGTLMCMSILSSHPTSKEGNLYEEISWPSLLEKAVWSLLFFQVLVSWNPQLAQYMKLMGGYDFPGS